MKKRSENILDGFDKLTAGGLTGYILTTKRY
jgi:hypothetical protein